MRLSLSEHEGEVFNFDNQACRKEYTLAAKFFTKRALNIEAVARTLKPLWRTKQDFEIQDMGNHILLFVFENELDANRVLLGEPWSFDKYLVVLRRYEDDSSLQRLRFDTAKFWVQVHGLPVRRMVTGTAENLCKSVGRVIHSNDRSEIECGDFMRIRVEVDVHRPLCRGRRVRFNPDREGWVSFRYERLPIFCHWCGVLNHDSKECDLWLQSKGELRADTQEYGSWLRVDSTSLIRKKVVRVSGMGAPNATSSHGQSMMEKPGMNTDTEGPNTVEVQQGEQRVAETNVDDVSVSGMVFPTKGALSNVLGNEEAFQAHLKEIDVELEGRNDKVLHEGGAECDEVRQMVEESNVVETN